MTYDVLPLPGYDVQTGLLLATLEDSTREWRENLESPPVEAIVWQPYPQGYSIGALLLHLIDCETGWIEQFCLGRPSDPAESKLLLSEEVQQDDGIWPVPPAEPIEWYLNLHDQIRERTRQALVEFVPEKLHSGRENSYTQRWVLAHVIGHDSYTGGQAVALHELWKRLNKAPSA